MLQFNTQGLLMPADNIISTLEDFEKYFTFNHHRKMLHQQYLSYLIDLQQIGIENFTQWIDGNFVTRKTTPNDIDIVTFVPEGFYNLYQQQIIALKEKYLGLDCYYVKDFHEDDPKRVISDFDRIQWLFLFGTDRKKQNKGFIELKF
jgi:hypothetical protein